MDIHSILAELRSEKERLEEAILTIERLAASSLGKRRGRPPKWMASAKAATSSLPASKTHFAQEETPIQRGDAETHGGITEEAMGVEERRPRKRRKHEFRRSKLRIGGAMFRL